MHWGGASVGLDGLIPQVLHVIAVAGQSSNYICLYCIRELTWYVAQYGNYIYHLSVSGNLIGHKNVLKLAIQFWNGNKQKSFFGMFLDFKLDYHRDINHLCSQLSYLY